MKLVLFLGLLVGAVYIWGRSMPRDHKSSSMITLVAQPDSVYGMARDFAKTPTWWSDVNSVKRITGRKRESWEQDMKGTGPVRLEVTSFIDGQRLVTTILNDDQQDWGGKWTYEFKREGGVTEVRITEEGWVDPPLYRVLMKVRGGPHRSLDSYLRSLAAHFGETVSPRHDVPG